MATHEHGRGVQVLDTPSGRLVRSLYECGCKLGVSSRGWASLRELPGKVYKCIMANFELITFDFVTEPSTKGAWLLPYIGTYSAPVPRQAAAEALSRLGVGAVPVEAYASLPRARELKAGFLEFQRRLQVRLALWALCAATRAAGLLCGSFRRVSIIWQRRGHVWIGVLVSEATRTESDAVLCRNSRDFR